MTDEIEITDAMIAAAVKIVNRHNTTNISPSYQEIREAMLTVHQKQKTLVYVKVGSAYDIRIGMDVTEITIDDPTTLKLMHRVAFASEYGKEVYDIRGVISALSSLTSVLCEKYCGYERESYLRSLGRESAIKKIKNAATQSFGYNDRAVGEFEHFLNKIFDNEAPNEIEND